MVDLSSVNETVAKFFPAFFDFAASLPLTYTLNYTIRLTSSLLFRNRALRIIRRRT